MATSASTEGSVTTTDRVARGRHLAPRPKRGLRAIGTMPVQLVGSLVARTGPVPDAADGRRPSRRRSKRGAGAEGQHAAAGGTAPSVAVLLHPVSVGESAADIAQRHGVSTASLLAANGLSWRSPLTPGVVLTVPGTQRPDPAGTLPPEIERHRVGAGETASAIAAAHGLPTAAVLLANGLSRSSRILPGQQLVIPSVPGRTASGELLALTGEMRANAEVVVAVGRRSGLPDEAVVVALAAAMQDSSLRNLDFGEHVGVGLFHRRPGAGWGDRRRLLDPEAAAVAFYGGRGGDSGLLGLTGWTLMSVGEAACFVQTGTAAGAAAYAKWEGSARIWLADLDGRR